MTTQANLRAVGAPRELTKWELCYRAYDPAEEPLREALCTLGNGYFATRGAAEESRAGGAHYPGTYLAGGYNRLESEVGGRVIENEDLVNWPNWLPLTFRCGDEEEWFHLDRATILEFEQELDLLPGILSRRVRFRDAKDREFTLSSRRIASMADPHAAAIEWILTPVNWSGQLTICSAIDGGVTNDGIARYRTLRGDHLEVLDCGGVPGDDDTVCLVARARTSHVTMAQAVRTRVTVEGSPAACERRTETRATWVGQHLTLRARAITPITVEKVLALYTSRDAAISEPRLEACQHIRRAPAFNDLLELHQFAWKRHWDRADLELMGQKDCYAQLVLRLHIFHMLQAASMNTIGLDVGIPARGLHGEAYRGHIFWDELFILPFYNLRIPELSRALLLYRYRRLGEARHGAREAGHEGAMFPWQSGSNGREESQVLHLNPKSGRWIPDDTHRQRHVNAAIAYNVWQYFEATCDMEFLSFYGAEMLLEIARFWASVATYSEARQRYEIRGVVGPDEFHTGYAGRDGEGLHNNAYTNVMAVWVLHIAQVALDRLPAHTRAELLKKLRVSGEELARWDEIARRMYVPLGKDGIISQFDGWDDLEELDWEALAARHGDIQRIDRILEAEGDDPNRYKATKQADVLMLFFLFSAEELQGLFERLGYPFDTHLIPENVAYYLARTSHGSTLSRVVHAWVLARTDRKRSWHLFQEALASDIDDVQGGTTAEGVHIGAMGGTVDLLQRCYTGLEMRGEVLWLNPALPEGLGALRFAIRYRGHWLELHVTHEAITVSLEDGSATPARIGFAGTVHELVQGGELSFELKAKAP